MNRRKEKRSIEMEQRRLYIDLHVLQTVPPSCLNRDDTGSPKTASYGGATRARVSSQAWKRAVRLMFRQELLPRDRLGERTKKIVALVAGEISELAPDGDAAALALEALKNAGLEKVKEETGTDALFFMSYDQAKALAELIVAGSDDKKAYKAALKEKPSVDMVLFGRMVANDPSLNYDAAVQVAHSISTHAVQNEYDYFTAVDDCAPEDNAGAGHLGTVEYNSSTLYRYATVNLMELEEHLGKEMTPAVVRAFAEAFIRSMPTGKQNTFANRTLPDAVYIAIREDQPINLCGAFERAVSPSPEGYVEPSKRRLVEYARQLYQTCADAPSEALTVGAGLEELAQAMPLKEGLCVLEEAVRRRLGGNGVE